jgi:hypothetical protein
VLAVDPGRHRLIVEHEGHTPVALEFLATEGKTAEVRFDLAVLTGSLTVESPAGKLATLIDRQGERTQIPVGVSEEVPAKTYQVEIDAPGHYRATASTRVIAGKRSSVTLTPMPKVAAVGAISVETNLTGVKIYIDDELYAFAPVRIPSIVVGSHRIRFGLDDHTASLPGFLVREDGTFEVTVEEGATLSLRPTFRRKSAQ